MRNPVRGRHEFTHWRRFATLAVLLAVAHAARATEPVTPDQIAAAVAQLADSRFEVREQACAFLWRAGAPARAALEAAARTADPEVARGAEDILWRLRVRIMPDTPPEVVGLMDRYRGGTPEARRDVLEQLIERGAVDNAIALFADEPGAMQQGPPRQEFLRSLRGRAVEAIIQGRLDRAERLLAFAAGCDAEAAHQLDYTALLLGRGRLQAKIEALEADGAARPGATAGPFLARLLMVAGRVAEAKPIVEATNDEGLEAAFYLRCADWRSLATRHLIPGDAGVESLGFSAALNRLAGRDAECAAAVAQLVALAREQPDTSWMCAEALLITARWQQAIELLSTFDRESAFELMCLRMQPVEAFALIGVADPRTGTAAWFRARAEAAEATPQEARRHVSLGLAAARALFRLGEAAEAERVLEAAAASATAEAGWQLYEVFETAHRLGLHERAERHALELLAREQMASSVIGRLFPGTSVVADLWWACFRRWYPGEECRATLQRLRAFLAPGSPPQAGEPSLASACERVERESESLAAVERLGRLRVLGETCILKGDSPLGIACFEKEAAVGCELDAAASREEHAGHHQQRALVRSADVHAREQRWPQAAAAYGRAWAVNRRRAYPLYMRGYALLQAGDVEQGRERMERATVLPLGSADERQELAAGLEAVGLEEAANAEWERILQLCDFGSWEEGAVMAPAQKIGNKRSATDKLEAAALFQRMLLPLLKTNSGYLHASDYVDVVHVIHRARARGLMAGGQGAAAAWDITEACAARPGDAEFVEEVTKHLDAAGRTAEAEQVFAACYARYDRVCREFPRAAMHHNALAWLAARCGRRLDDALLHAAAAVRLDPERAEFLDTLAEVHFRLGDRPQAIAIERRVVEREPTNPEFRARLERFERGE
jgi:tetratricopeptide (TPR) repeat protein